MFFTLFKVVALFYVRKYFILLHFNIVLVYVSILTLNTQTYFIHTYVYTTHK